MVAASAISLWPQEASAPSEFVTPGTDSGTFDYFTEEIVGKAKSSRQDYTASEDDNTLVNGVAGDKNALGYFGYAYFAENKKKISAVPLDRGKIGIEAEYAEIWFRRIDMRPLTATELG